MKALSHRAALGLAVILVTGCASIQVQSDYDQQASFARIKTYNWVEQSFTTIGDPAVVSPLVARRVRAAVDSVLAEKGYAREPSEDADFRIALRITATPESDVIDTYGGTRAYGSRYYYGRGRFPFDPFYGYPYYGYGAGTGVYVRQSLESTLVLDVVDATTDQVIWRGWAADRLDRHPDPETVQRFVVEAVTKLLAGFPPDGSTPPESPRRGLVAPDET